MRRYSLLLSALVLLLNCRPSPHSAVSANAPGDSSAGGSGGAATAGAQPKHYESTAPAPLREKPPADGVTPAWSFPKIQHAELSNGLRISVVERHHLPLVELRLVLLSGTATDGDKPGVALLAGEMLKVGGTGQLSSRQLLDQVESLGSSLEITTDRDATTVSLAVTRQNLDTALGILSDLVQKPRFLPDEYRKLKRRQMDRTDSLAHSDPAWAASMVLYRELFELPSAVHPYATYDATSKQIEHVMLPDCKGWYGQHVTPGNALLVVAGDVKPGEVQESIKKVFSKWSGKAPAAPTFFRPMPPNDLELYLVDRPGSTQAEVFVGTLGPELQSDDWVPFKVGNQVLGGGVAGRLFLDVREQRSLAYRAFSSVDTIAHGPAPVVLRAGTQTAKAGLTLQALLEHVQRMSQAAPTDSELSIATHFLSDTFLLRVETVGALADMTAQLGVLGLPDDYYDNYRQQVSKATADQVRRSSKNFDAKRMIVVVAGDAQALTAPLSHFAKVNVIAPDKSFATSKIVPQDASAPLELKRMD